MSINDKVFVVYKLNLASCNVLGDRLLQLNTLVNNPLPIVKLTKKFHRGGSFFTNVVKKFILLSLIRNPKIYCHLKIRFNILLSSMSLFPRQKFMHSSLCHGGCYCS